MISKGARFLLWLCAAVNALWTMMIVVAMFGFMLSRDWSGGNWGDYVVSLAIIITLLTPAICCACYIIVVTKEKRWPVHVIAVMATLVVIVGLMEGYGFEALSGFLPPIITYSALAEDWYFMN